MRTQVPVQPESASSPSCAEASGTATMATTHGPPARRCRATAEQAMLISHDTSASIARLAKIRSAPLVSPRVTRPYVAEGEPEGRQGRDRDQPD